MTDGGQTMKSTYKKASDFLIGGQLDKNDTPESATAAMDMRKKMEEAVGNAMGPQPAGSPIPKPSEMDDTMLKRYYNNLRPNK